MYMYNIFSIGHNSASKLYNLYVCVAIPAPVYNFMQIGTNGYFSFEEPFYSSSPDAFPGTTTISAYYLVAPFWDDVDIRRRGNIYFEVHTLVDSSNYLSIVSNFVAPDGSFTGTWMVLAQWDMVHSWPDGESESDRQFFADFYGIETSAVRFVLLCMKCN